LHGNFATINNGIAFLKDGRLGDGQHRLYAIIEAQKPITTFVMYGMNEDSILAIDEGRPRSIQDVGRFMDIDVNRAKGSTVSYLLEQMGVKAVTSRQDHLAFYEKHSEAIQFATKTITKKGVKKAPVSAAIARAYYHVNHERLEEFMKVLQSGIYKDENEDGAAIRLREWLLGASSGKNTGSWRLECYRKTESAIIHFAQHHSIVNLKARKEEQFPLPEERQSDNVIQLSLCFFSHGSLE